MALRCFLFSSDQETVEPICQVLAGLGVEGESCSEAWSATEKISSQPYQLVIIDWDNQPDAEALLATARQRKASERPLTLAIVSDDTSVPKALRAGANSILRKPIMVNQVRDTLTTARDLLRAKQEPQASRAAAAAAIISPIVQAAPAPPAEMTLRAGEFLQSSGSAPATLFDVESDMQKSIERSATSEVDPLKDLEPVAASVAEEEPQAPPPPPANEPRGLQWYLNARAGTAPSRPPLQTLPPVSAPKPQAPKPELIGFDESPAYDEPAAPSEPQSVTGYVPKAAPVHPQVPQQKAEETKLFAHISGEDEPADESGEESKRGFRLGKGAIAAALLLATCGIVGAPQAPWHPQVKGLWARGRQMTHAWLNPQLVTPTQVPTSHEDFGRAGDEYKLPVAEPIPDATTDPSQIRVEPRVDPSIKQPANPDSAAEQTPAQDNPGDASAATPDQAPQIQVQENPTQPPAGTTPSGPPTGVTGTASVPAANSPATEPPHVESLPASLTAPPPRPTPPPRSTQPHYTPQPTPTNVPSSLKSQMVSMTPEASGNKPVEAALPSIEPVSVPEGAERGLLADQPEIPYPASARGQQGTVILQVLIGRDGAVQDAKFMQGSLAFARAAIDGVKQWKFRPYTMNGRAVSVQTQMTLTFKPTP